MIRFFSILAIAFELLPARALAEAPVTLETVLDRAGKRVEEFWDQFSAVTCTETVSQAKLGSGGKVLIQRTSAFDYLVILQLTGDDLIVDESRLAQGPPNKESDRPLLATSGFATLLLIFHPYFQGSYEFSLGGAEDSGGKELREVRFAHIRGRRAPSVLQLRSRDYPLEWAGSAWIEPQTGIVSRISVGLKAPMDDVGLKRLSSDVRYAPVRFQDSKEQPWLPQTATIEADTVHQHWRNTHQFSRYRKFSVSTDSKTEAPKQ